MTSLIHQAPTRTTFALTSALVLGLAALIGCASTDSATNLNTDGPPMVEQVRLKDAVTDTFGVVHATRVFGFGTHVDANESDTPPRATLQVAATTQSFRVVMDELLVGNYLENISCTTAVENDGSSFQFVPVGATPDDIARCSVAPDVLASTCTGDHAVCICHRDAGCGTFAKGAPVGVLDGNLDGAADLHQFRKDEVSIRCGDGLALNVPLNLDTSYWNPSGDQQVPAVGGFDALGPAIILNPLGALPANVKCQLVFAADITDKSSNNVCVPPDGDVTKDCTPPDTSAFTFQMEPLVLVLSNPMGSTLTRTDDIIVSTSDNIPLDPTSVSGITLTENGVPYTMFTVSVDTSGSLITIHSTNPTGFDPNVTYVLTVPTSVTDTYGQHVVQALVATFMTGA